MFVHKYVGDDIHFFRRLRPFHWLVVVTHWEMWQCTRKRQHRRTLLASKRWAGNTVSSLVACTALENGGVRVGARTWTCVRGSKWHRQGVYSPPRPTAKENWFINAILLKSWLITCHTNKKVESRVFGILCAKKHKAGFFSHNFIGAWISDKVQCSMLRATVTAKLWLDQIKIRFSHKQKFHICHFTVFDFLRIINIKQQTVQFNNRDDFPQTDFLLNKQVLDWAGPNLK